MLKRNLLACIFLLQAVFGFAQVTDNSLPPSHYISPSTSGNGQMVIAPPVTMPAMNNDSLKVALTAGEDPKEGESIVGIVLKYNIDFFQKATPIDLEDGQRIWRVNIISPTAEALQVVFSKFQLPATGKLYIYNYDRSMVLGAFTAASASGMATDTFTTQSIHSGNIYIEYTEGLGVTTPTAIIKISKVAHFYKSLFRSGTTQTPQAPCNIDVACPLGSGWGQEINAVVLFHVFRVDQNNKEIIIEGSGTLLNSKTAPFKAYLLTAYHVMDDLISNFDHIDSNGDDIPGHPFIPMNSLTIYYNYQSATCGGTIGGPNYFDSYTSVGGRMVSYSHYTQDGDYALIELGSVPPLSQKICYAGWDRTIHDPDNPTDIVGTEFTGIHHPQLQQKKISRTTNYAQHVGYKTNSNPYWYAISWQQGITESYSSGSALFNQAHRVIGALTGGTSSCNNPQGQDSYYKFSNAWQKGNWAQFLAPNDPNTTTIDTYCPIDFCKNGVQDAGETGIDCGGSCPNLCDYLMPSIQAMYITNNGSINNFCISNNSWVTVNIDVPYTGMTGPSINSGITTYTPTIEWTIVSGNVSFPGHSYSISYKYVRNQPLLQNLDCSGLFQNGTITEEVVIVARLYDDQGRDRGSFPKKFTLKKGIDNVPSNGSLISNNVCLNTPRTLGFTNSSAYTYQWTCPSNSAAIEALHGGEHTGQPVFNADKIYQYQSDETMLRFNLTISNPSGCGAYIAHYVQQNNFTATMPSTLNVCTTENLPITLNNGIAPYTYTWTNNLGGPTSEISNTNSTSPKFIANARENKDYTLIIRDGANCTATLPLAVTYRKTTLQANSGMNYNVCDITNLNGTQLFSGGISPYTFSSGTPSATTFADFNYTFGGAVSPRSITVTDADGCKATSSFNAINSAGGPLKITNVSAVTQSPYLKSIGIDPATASIQVVGYYEMEACGAPDADSTEFEANFTIEGGCPPYTWYWSAMTSRTSPYDGGPLFASKNPYNVKKVKFSLATIRNTEPYRSWDMVLSLVAVDSKGYKVVQSMVYLQEVKRVQPTLAVNCTGSDILIGASNYISTGGGNWNYTGKTQTSWVYGSDVNVVATTGSQLTVRPSDFTERNVTFKATNVCGTFLQTTTLNKLTYKINGIPNTAWPTAIPISYNYSKPRVMLDATTTSMCFPNYFISVQECDAAGQTLTGSTELADWFTVSNYTKPNAIDIDNFCTQKGLPLTTGKYYRVKMALGTFGWKETNQVIYMNPCNATLSYTINNQAINWATPIVIAKDQPAILNGEASNICQPQYFFGIQECDRYGNVQNTEAADWIMYYDSPYTLSAFDIRKFCLNKNYPLVCEKYYKVKLATGGGSTWKELSTIIYVESCVEAGANVRICKGTSAQLLASASTVYNWTADATLSATNIYNPVATPATDKTYYITRTDPVTGKVVTDNVTVYVTPLPDVSVPAEIHMMTETKGTLVVKANGSYTYTWSPSTGLSATNVANPTFTVQGPITYTVTAKETINNCTSTTQTNVVIVDQPGSPLFDGVSSVIKIPTTPSYSTAFPTTDFIFEAWVQLPTQSVPTVALLSSRVNATQGFLWAITDNGQKMTLSLGNSSASSIQFPSVYDGKCHHLCAMRLGTNARFLIDGVIIGDPIAANSLFNPLTIPSYLNIGNDDYQSLPLKGIVSEVRIWNHNKPNGLASIAADMYKVYNSSTPYLVGYFRFLQDNIQSVVDESGTANNAGYYGISKSNTIADPLRTDNSCRGTSKIVSVVAPAINYAASPLTVNYTLMGFPIGSTIYAYLSNESGFFPSIPTQTITSSGDAGTITFNISAIPNGTNYQVKLTNYSGTKSQTSNVFTITRPNTGLLYTNGSEVATIPVSAKFGLGFGDFTLEAWVNFGALRPSEPTYRTILSRRLYNTTNGTYNGLLWAMGKDGKMFVTINANTTYSSDIPGALYDNQCHFIVVRRLANVVTFFVDGVNKTGGTNGADMNTGGGGVDLWIGRDKSGNSMYGSIQELRFWKKGRTDNEITTGSSTLYNNSYTNLIGYWRFKEASIQTIIDETASPQNGYLGITSGQDYADPGRSYLVCAGNAYEKIASAQTEENLTNSSALVTYYPNPFEQTLTVLLRDESERETSATLTIVNLQGIEVYSGVVNVNFENQVLFKAPVGVYIAVVQYAGMSYQQKIFKASE